ncbi:MAG: histidine kinase dimerization/phosphoacceptor domain -containing protein [Bacteroidota bacterium]
MSETLKKDLNKEFQTHYLISSLPNMRMGFILTLIMFFCFALFNLIFFPNSSELQFYNRFWIISPALIISIIVSYIRPLFKWLGLIFIILNLGIALSVFYVGFAATPSLEGYTFYYSWVMLVVIGLFTFFRMPFITLTCIGACMVIAYLTATILNGTYLHNPFVFFNNLFFVIAMFSIGFIMAFMFRELNWKNFLDQKALSDNYQKLLIEMEERKQAEKALRQSEFIYINTLNSIPDWIYVVDKELVFVMLNSSLQEEHLRQGFPVNCIGKKLTKVYPFIPSSTIAELRQVFNTGEIIIGEQQFFLRDKTIYGETRKVPIFKDNEVIQVMTIMRNRSKEKEIEELKQKNIVQKEIMLREIHHRVKNNLAIVVSLLNLQLRNNTDPELNRIIKDVEMRIRSMALIHEHLYRSENLDRIPLSAYLHSLATIVTGTFSGHRINLVIDLEPTDVTIETALPIGLITNELLTNAFKYAFPRRQDGEIYIQLTEETDEVNKLIIKDNGIGLPANFSFESDKSLGMFIVRLLVEQIDGKIEILQQNGTEFIIRFPITLNKKRIDFS